VTNKTWIPDWNLDLFASITATTNRLQSLGTVTSTAQVVHLVVLLVPAGPSRLSGPTKRPGYLG
jgi:hypothetical protein